MGSVFQGTSLSMSHVRLFNNSVGGSEYQPPSSDCLLCDHDGLGGALFVKHGPVYLENVTFASNRAGTAGGGLFVEGWRAGSTNRTEVTLKDTVWDDNEMSAIQWYQAGVEVTFEGSNDFGGSRMVEWDFPVSYEGLCNHTQGVELFRKNHRFTLCGRDTSKWGKLSGKEWIVAIPALNFLLVATVVACRRRRQKRRKNYHRILYRGLKPLRIDDEEDTLQAEVMLEVQEL